MRKVITYGVFDLFHEGHYSLLKRARELGDHLTVGVTSNRFDELRGKLDTVDSLERRMENVLATGFVDEVIPETYNGQKADDIKNRGIDVLVAGSDWCGRFDYLGSLCEVVYLERTPGVSSSKIRDERFPKVRLGLIGNGRIARRFISEARCVGNVQVEGVYNPKRESAEAFRYESGLTFVTDDLDELFSRVDAVYIASPHQTHAPYAKAALSAGRHVLCEKPLALAKADACELFELAQERSLVLLEAIKTAYCPGFCELVDIIDSGAIGEVRDVEAAFTKLTPHGVRERDDVRYGGAFLELGSYSLLPIVRLLKADGANVYFDSINDENGVDLYTKAFFSGPSGFGLAKAGLGVKSEGQLVIAGTKGYVLVPSPWWKTRYFEVRHEDPNQVERHELAFAGDGLRYEISEFAHLVQGHEGREPKLDPAESVRIAEIMERFLAWRGRT